MIRKHETEQIMHLLHQQKAERATILAVEAIAKQNNIGLSDDEVLFIVENYRPKGGR